MTNHKETGVRHAPTYDWIRRRIGDHEWQAWVATAFWIAIVAAILGMACGLVWGADVTAYLAALRQVETGGAANPVDGDGGGSIGPYQIRRAYHADSRVPGPYERCRDRGYAERVVLAYARRYEPAALRNADWQALARLHNGGPNWRRKSATVAYWQRVRAKMRSK